MVFLSEADDKRSIQISEFIDLTKNIKWKNINEFKEVHLYLGWLSNNKSLLPNELNKALKQSLPHQSYTDNGLVVYRSQDFMLRFTFWEPMDEQGQIYDQNKYLYHLAHNHDSDILTVGYIGSGYITDIYTCDLLSLKGEDREFVSVLEVDRIQLKEGRILLYEEDKHIHIQYPPHSLSVALNLIPQSRFKSTQYDFDMTQPCIIRQAQNNQSFISNLMKLVAVLGDENSLDLLWYLTGPNQNRLTRLQAFRTLMLRHKGNDITNVINAIHSSNDPVLIADFEKSIQNKVKFYEYKNI